MFYNLARSIMFKTDAESSHHFALASLKALQHTPNLDVLDAASCK